MYHKVTSMLIELGLPSFDTVLARQHIITRGDQKVLGFT